MQASATDTIQTKARVTLRDVANEAGVSMSAVSAALAGGRRMTAGVSDVTRNAILEIAKKRGFRPHLHARALASGKSFLLGLVYRTALTHLQSEAMLGLQEVVQAHDYSLIVHYFANTAQEELRQIRRCLDRRVEGMIVTPALDPDGTTNAKQFVALQREGLPMVILLTPVIAGISCVAADHHISARKATQHLIDLGHRRILIVVPDGYQSEVAPNPVTQAARQWVGYREIMTAAGLSPVAVTLPRFAFGGFNLVNIGRDLAPGIMTHPSRPTAVVATSDRVAIGLLQGFKKAGLRLPQDMSVVGFDDLDLAAVVEPALTTLRYPLREIGRHAGEMIFRQLKQEQVEDVFIEPELVVRESTAAFGGG